MFHVSYEVTEVSLLVICLFFILAVFWSAYYEDKKTFNPRSLLKPKKTMSEYWGEYKDTRFAKLKLPFVVESLFEEETLEPYVYTTSRSFINKEIEWGESFEVSYPLALFIKRDDLYDVRGDFGDGLGLVDIGLSLKDPSFSNCFDLLTDEETIDQSTATCEFIPHVYMSKKEFITFKVTVFSGKGPVYYEPARYIPEEYVYCSSSSVRNDEFKVMVSDPMVIDHRLRVILTHMPEHVMQDICNTVAFQVSLLTEKQIANNTLKKIG